MAMLRLAWVSGSAAVPTFGEKGQGDGLRGWDEAPSSACDFLEETERSCLLALQPAALLREKEGTSLVLLGKLRNI